MGVVNLTPDSFSDGGQFLSVDAALRHVECLIADGATILDIGAESSRPGADPVSTKEEINRLTPFLVQYRSHFDIPLSLDTSKADVASVGIAHGVRWINDITGLSDDQMIPVIKKGGVGVIIMHMKGMPKTMQETPHYKDVMKEVYVTLDTHVNACQQAGISEIIIDPGIGFGKTVSHNLQLLKQLKQLKSLKCPILVGTSRKSFIGQITGEGVDNREEGTIASSLYAISQGADIIRVHDVGAMQRALSVWQAICLASD
jgi:dihydropteroate synthase